VAAFNPPLLAPIRKEVLVHEDASAEVDRQTDSHSERQLKPTYENKSTKIDMPTDDYETNSLKSLHGMYNIYETVMYKSHLV